MLLSLYRAMLGASLAIKLYREPVSSLEELLSSDLKVAVAANSSIQDYFSHASSASIQAQIWREKLQPEAENGAFLSSTFNFTQQVNFNFNSFSDTRWRLFHNNWILCSKKQSEKNREFLLESQRFWILLSKILLKNSWNFVYIQAT